MPQQREEPESVFVWVIGIWILGFVWNLVVGIWDLSLICACSDRQPYTVNRSPITFISC
jgi:hypothetical protein